MSRLLFILIFLSACTFDEYVEEDDNKYDTIQRERLARQARVQEMQDKRSEKKENSEESENSEEEIPKKEVEESTKEEVLVEEVEIEEEPSSESVVVSPSPSLKTTSEEQNPPSSMSALTSSENEEPVVSTEMPSSVSVVEVRSSSEEEVDSVEQTSSQPSIIEESIRGVYISNQTNEPIFYVDKVTNERVSILSNSCFSRSYPEETGLSRLFFSIITQQNEIVCDNCMINESMTSSYFLVEVASVYSLVQVFNSAPITIEPGTVIFNQSEKNVKNNCGLK